MRIREPRGDRAFYIANYSVLILFTLMVLYPLVYVLSASFSSARAIANNDVVLWPVGLTADAYKTIMQSPNLVIGFGNSVLYTVAGALIGTALTMLAGYASSRDDLPFRRLITFFFLVPALFAGGIVPTYIVVQQLGLLDTGGRSSCPGR